MNNKSYLCRLDAAPAQEKYNLIHGWIANEPRPFFAELRENRPILETEMGTLFARFDDVVDVLSHPSVFTVEPYVSKLGPTYMLSQDDTPLHTREKGIMQAMLNRDDLPRIRTLVQSRSVEFLEAAKGKIDLVNDFGRSVPVALVQDYFGFEDIASVQLKEWSYWIQYDSFHNHAFSLAGDSAKISQKAAESRTALAESLKALVPKILAKIAAGNPPDTVVARMLQSRFPDSVGFPMQNAVRNMSGLLIGAVETTSQAAVQVVQVLLNRPTEFSAAKALAEAGDPAFDGYVWESLRFDPIGPYLFRKCASDYTVAPGTERAQIVKQGTTVLPSILSAMFDPSRFPNPDSFDPKRPWFDTFHMGFGIHECLGKYIGMVMIPEMVKQVVLLPNLKADAPIDKKGRPFPEYFPLSWGS